MDLNKFEYILRVAEEKSFTKTVSKLYISQPALSQYVASLKFFEEELFLISSKKGITVIS